ncbi:MAG: molybdopterin-binding protein [Candidatus Odinarchaeum yellowstonii]|uniref:Molybdopterin-binding protein n=1 Tax=Odinarchaeota yellowstonii (strain LCB_4) TaxID=1841599 RepID=A0AAF0D3U3_ODILC|nr:MAG: molybdopterin-binding protein [Candidatus Odinarchaeum yellowstonii]
MLNTNSQWLSKNITKLGGSVKRIYTIGDSVEEISDIIKYIINRRPEYLIISGGLGPTFDDKTLQGLAVALNKRLIINKTALESVQEKYRKLYSKGLIKTGVLLKSRIKMAELPEGAEPLENPVGTAPAVKIEYESVKIYCLPGVPEELKAIFAKHIAPLLKKELNGIKYYERSISVEGVAESEISDEIEIIMNEVKQVYIKSHPQAYEGGCRLRICLSTKGDRNAVKILKKASEMVEEAVKKLGGRVLEGEDR